MILHENDFFGALSFLLKTLEDDLVLSNSDCKDTKQSKQIAYLKALIFSPITKWLFAFAGVFVL